jgi:Flp pilus assembly protein TadD
MALTAMATTHELWTIGNLFFVLRSYGIPTQRDELAALLGLPIVRDEAAELAAQARFHRVHMHNPGEAASLLRRAGELAPTTPGLWHQLAQALHAADDNVEALHAVDRALSLDPITPRPTSPAASSSSTPNRPRPPAAFARAAELGHQPLQAPPTAPPAWR